MCMLSTFLILTMIVASYHFFYTMEQSAPTLRVTTPVHYALVPMIPLRIKDPRNKSEIEIKQVDQGELYTAPIKKYIWRSLQIRHCEPACN